MGAWDGQVASPESPHKRVPVRRRASPGCRPGAPPAPHPPPAPGGCKLTGRGGLRGVGSGSRASGRRRGCGGRARSAAGSRSWPRPARLRAPRAAAAAPCAALPALGAVQQAPARHGRGEGGWIRLRTPRRGLSPQHLKTQVFFFFFFFIFPPPPPFSPPHPSCSPHLFPSSLSYMPSGFLPAEADLQAEVGLSAPRLQSSSRRSAAGACVQHTRAQTPSRMAPLRERCHEAAQPASLVRGE